MGLFDSILAKIQGSASERDQGTAAQKCPKKKKPAIYLIVARSDTGEGVSGIKVDISKPTKKSLSTNGDGEVKVDPAKLGRHNLQVLLTDEQKKKYSPPPPITTTTAKGMTAVVFFLLETLPTLVIEVKDAEGNKPVDGIRIRSGLLPELTTSGGKADFGGIPAGRYRVILTLPKPLETKVEIFHRKVSIAVIEPGYTPDWMVDLAAGDTRHYEVILSRVRSVEFILAEEKTDKPIVGAKLHAKLPGGGKAVVVTDSLGCAKVTFAKEGKVEIERIEVTEPGSVIKVEAR